MNIVSNQTPILEAALEYASLGFRVFPLHGVVAGCCTCGKAKGDGHKVGKHPATSNGCNDGTTDAEVIRRWWGEKPWANVGIALDAHHFGLDGDPRNGGDKTMASWEGEHGHLALTPHAKTGSGGDHWIFRLPPGYVVKNRANVAPGIDTRSAGGYLVAPPSRHESGGVYEWLEPLDTPLAMAPEWLLAKVGATSEGVKVDRGEAAINSGSPVSLLALPFTFTLNMEPDDFASHPGAPSGRRNQELCRLTGIHLSRGDSLKSIEAMAVSWGSRCTPPCGADDVLLKVRALARKEAAKRGEGEDSREGVGDEVGGDGKEGNISSHGGGDGVNSFLPFLPKAEGENAEAEGPSQPPNPSLLSTMDAESSEHVLDLTKKHFAIEPLPPVGGREGYAYRQEAKAESMGFGLVAEGEGALGFEPLSIAHANAPLRGAERGEGQGDEQEAESVIVCDTASVQAQDDWPTLDEAAYHGLLGDIVKAIEPETEADPVGVLLSLLTAFGNAVGRSPYFAAGADSHHANVFTTVVGNTASRKGMSLGVAKYLMQKAEPDWYANHIGYGLSSGEGLIQRVADDEVDADGQGFFGFAMPKAKRLLCVETEFVKLLQVKGREGNTLNANMRNAWDGSPLETMIVQRSGEKSKQKPRSKATCHHISILGHITPKELQKAMGGSVDMANGFANRFLWALVKRARYLPDGGDISVLDDFIGPMGEAIAKAKGIGRVVRDDGAKALWHEVYRGLSSADEESSGRAEAQTLRLSLLYALLDGSEVVNASHLRAALAVWRYCEHSARIIFGGQSGDSRGGGGVKDEALDMRLLNAIVQAPGIGRTALLRAFRGQTAEAMGEALASLYARGLAHPRSVQAQGGGRPAECWWPGPEPDGPDGGDDEGASVVRGFAAYNANAPAEVAPTVGSGFIFTMEADGEGDDPPAEGHGKERKEGINSPSPDAGVNSFPEFLPDAQSHGKELEAGDNSFLPDPVADAGDRNESLPPQPPSQSLSTQTQAFGEAEFFAEYANAQPTLEEDNILDGEHDGMSMQDFAGMLKLHGITVEEARHLHKLTAYQRKQVKHAQDYALAQAQRRKRERELEARRIPDEDADDVMKAFFDDLGCKPVSAEGRSLCEKYGVKLG